MLVIGSEEMVHSVITQRIEIIVGAVGIQRGTDGIQAGVCNGRGRKALIQIQVVGCVDLFVCLSDGLFVFAQAIQQGSIDLEVARRFTRILQAVIDNGRNFAAVTAILQAVYCFIVGTYPFNSFLSGFIISLGTCVLSSIAVFQLVL